MDASFRWHDDSNTICGQLVTFEVNSMSKSRPKYTVLIRPLSTEDGGGWLAIVPDLPGCSSDGESQADALNNVQDAIGQWLATAEKYGQPVPRPDNFVSVAFPENIPDDIRHQAEDIARRMAGLSASAEPAPELVHAIYAQLARTAIRSAHL